MPLDCTTVFLPCHALDDFPTWLEESEADDLLAAWTAAWHPALVAAIGATPRWSSVDLPVAAGSLLGIVPAPWDDRFAAQFEAGCSAGSAFVRRVSGVEAITQAAGDRLGLPAGPLAGGAWVADFHALGLAALLAEVLARRMRTQADLDATGFSPAVVTAARAAVDGRDAEARTALHEAFDALAATRARYYPVDCYVVDLVLLAASKSRCGLANSLDSPVPVAVVCSGTAAAAITAADAAAADVVRDAVASGRLEVCGGRATDAPLDFVTPEAAAASFAAGIEMVRSHVGAAPASFARVSGGTVPLLVSLASGWGLEGGIWTPFDGSLVPDVGGGMIRWQAGGDAVDLLASTPLDARSARTILALPDTLGDALDRDHVATLLFAHHAGTASRWHALLRRIGSWTSLLGTFVTPRELARRTAGAATPVTLEPDAFPPTMPCETAPSGVDPISAAVADAAAEAAARVAAVATVARAVVAPAAISGPAAAQPRRWLSYAVPGLSARGPDRLVLDNGVIRVEVHPQTGGLLSLRRAGDASNRLSQQLAIRTTPPRQGESPAPADDRGRFTRMVADEVERCDAAAGGDRIVSRGRLLDAGGGVAGRFCQRLQLVAGRPLAMLDVEIALERPLAGPLLENHVAARFAWHENEPVEIRRSLLTQSVVTERTRFTAPHFVEIVPDGGRFDALADRVAILTGGLPWHLLSTPHVLDSLLAGGATDRVTRRLGLGLGLRRPWDAALALAAGSPLGAAFPGVPDNVRLTVMPAEQPRGGACDAAACGGERLRVGLLESAGRAGEAIIDWSRPVARAGVVDFTGRPRATPAVAIDGTRTVVFLDRYQWLQLDVGFAG
ncbi:MAG: hypothetical protein ACKO4T_03180 [Planctomycetaceae bacterium]